MSDTKLFSIGRAIRKILERGTLTGVERETHYALQREIESDQNEYGWLRGGVIGVSVALNVPIELFVRQLTDDLPRFQVLAPGVEHGEKFGS